MRKLIDTIVNTQAIESKFIFNQEISNISRIKDQEGLELGFHRASNGHQVIFTKDDEGLDVAIEHCADGGKIFHLTQDSKGLPAMHEFKPDGSEIMYLLDAGKHLEKMVVTKANGDKLTYWFYYQGEILIQEERQNGGTLFKLVNDEAEALVWLHADGQVQAHGAPELVTRLKGIFTAQLDGADIN